MIGRAKLKGLRIAPRKVRIVANKIRNTNVNKAMTLLSFCRKSSKLPLIKLLRSAISNAARNKDVDVNNLYISELRVDSGPTMKRWMPRARGSATQILKRTSRIELVVKEK